MFLANAPAVKVDLMNLLDILLSGLSTGSTYAIIALGYTMVYGIAKMLNFAHGDVIMVGGYSLFVATLLPHSNPLLALLIAIVCCTVVGVLIEKFAYKPLRGASPLAVLITAIGMSYLLQSLAQIIFGSGQEPVRLLQLGSFTIAGHTIQWNTIVTLICAAVIMAALTIFVKYTRIGRAMIAVSEDKGAAQLMGINVNFIISVTFAIGSALAAFAGFFTVIKSIPATNTMGALPGIKAFTAAVIGGIGSIPGAMVGGILMGIVESIAQAYPAISPYTIAIEFSILIVILLVRPSGILGKKRREKV